MATRTVYYAAMSLDGFIAEPEEKLEWLTGFDPAGYAGEDGQPPGESYSRFIEEVGAVTMGSKTYEFILNENWAYGDLPAWVYTRRDLPKLEGATRMQFAAGDVRDLHDDVVAAADGKDVWVIGGGDLASQYVDAGLLDLVRVTVVPIVLGAGLPLFARPLQKPMRLLEVTPIESGMAELSYETQR